MSANDRLMSCPMCGARPQVNYGHTHHESWAYVVCECEVQTRNCHGKNDREAANAAVDMWNRRTA